MTTTSLFSSPPPNPKRKARRDLKKRRRKKRVGSMTTTTSDQDDDFWETSEVRPIITSNAVELGEDYWMDEEEYKREKEREEARKLNAPGQISEEKLWNEVLSPYKQNWIGFISVTIVVLAFIIQQFPELTENPIIPLPDL